MNWSKPSANPLNRCLNYVQASFAQNCMLCGADSGAMLVCQACHDSLPYLNASHACPVCATPQTYGVCGQCLQHPPYFQHGVAALRYIFPIDQLLQSYKYHQQLALAQLFGQLLREAVSDQPRPDVLLPMPLHPMRLRERGFNQALEIAKVVGKQLQLPLETKAAQRVVNTAAQATLDWESRMKNMRNAFAASPGLQGRHVAVIDDVMTSGATLNALSKTLHGTGISKISVWVVARAAPQH